MPATRLPFPCVPAIRAAVLVARLHPPVTQRASPLARRAGPVAGEGETVGHAHARLPLEAARRPPIIPVRRVPYRVAHRHQRMGLGARLQNTKVVRDTAQAGPPRPRRQRDRRVGAVAPKKPAQVAIIEAVTERRLRQGIPRWLRTARTEEATPPGGRRKTAFLTGRPDGGPTIVGRLEPRPVVGPPVDPAQADPGEDPNPGLPLA